VWVQDEETGERRILLKEELRVKVLKFHKMRKNPQIFQELHGVDDDDDYYYYYLEWVRTLTVPMH
jgi:hypothetical protein